jgi:large subunit ribosomal protein L20
MRATNGPVRRRRVKRLLKRAKGFRGSKSKLYRVAREFVQRADRYAYIHRRLKKREFRRLWILRINAAARAQGLSYSQFMNGLRKAGIGLDRKQISEMAIHDPGGFEALIETARKSG